MQPQNPPPKPTPDQVERALRGFLMIMRREFVNRHPGKPVRVPQLETVSHVDRIMLLRCMETALIVANTQPSPASSQPTS